jgi:hypothetical protein
VPATSAPVPVLPEDTAAPPAAAAGTGGAPAQR